MTSSSIQFFEAIRFGRSSDAKRHLNNLNDKDPYLYFKLFGIVLYTGNGTLTYCDDSFLRFIFSHCNKSELNSEYSGQTPLSYFIATQLLSMVQNRKVCDVERFFRRLLLFLLFGATVNVNIRNIPLLYAADYRDDDNKFSVKFTQLLKRLNLFLLKWEVCNQNVSSLKQRTLQCCFTSGIDVDAVHPDMFVLHGIDFQPCFNTLL